MKKLCSTALILIVAGTLAACSGGGTGAGGLAGSGQAEASGSGGGASVSGAHKGGTVTWAERSSDTPNYIYPFMPSSFFNVNNVNSFQQLMYRPLYWFGTGAQPQLNRAESLARKPKYRDNDTEVIIDLRHFTWSNGETLDTTQVMQWLNMLHAEKSNWALYMPGFGIPDDISSVSVDSSTQLTLHLTVPVSQGWFTDDMLSQITPLPEAWDITSAGAASGSGGCGDGAWGAASTDAACQAVWTYMNQQSGYAPGGQLTTADLANYTSNSLWQVVDGPWRLSSFGTNGEATFVPNPSYPHKLQPAISRFVMIPYSNDSDEVSALESRQLTVGYLPPSDLRKPAKSPLGPGGNPLDITNHYSITPYYAWSIDYFWFNLNSSAPGSVGPILDQSYVRQAMQMLVDQPSIIHRVNQGYAMPVYYAIPVAASTGALKTVPKTYQPKQAISSLRNHGWQITANGTDICERPGPNSNECGRGVPQGAQLQFTLTYPDDGGTLSQSLSMERASWAKAGIQVTLDPVSPQQAVQEATACSPGPSCTWQLAYPGTGWMFTPDTYYATGERIFLPGAPGNAGSWSDPVVENLISQTNHTNVKLKYYADYVASESPVIFQAEPATYIYEVSRNLHGVKPLNATGNLDPENFYFKKQSQ